jgi:iron complex outermembrane recepter protein
MANHPGIARWARWTTLLFCAAVGAHAAEAALEEIIVTAQKRDENVQDIPLTINVVNGAVLDRFNIRDTNDLASSLPGLVIQQTPQNLSQVTVRGLGTGAGGESLDQSVGLFIDGVWAGRIREFQASLFDLERVEVIKGSQTALLGKNTSLGAVSLVSRRPGDELAGYIQGDYESEFGSRYANGAVDIPTDFGNYRLAFNNVSEQGYVDNETTGNEVPQRNQSTGRASAQFDIADESNLLLLYQYDDLNIQGDTFQPDNDAEGFIAGMDPTANIDIDRTKNAWTSHADNGDADDKQDSQRAIAEYEQAVGEYLFTALSGWSTYDNQRLTDSDFLSVDYLTTSYDSDNEQFSQEFRLTSPAGQRLDYVAGLFYLYADMHYSSILDASFPPPYLLGGLPLDGANQLNYEQDTQVWSPFGQLNLALAERWRATLGLRYTDEEKSATWGRERTRSAGPLSDILADLLYPEVPPTDLNRSEDNVDGSINVQYSIAESATTYLSWARGSKSGGFTTEVALPENAEYDTEEADTTELGIKSLLAGGAAMLNASLFYTEIQNFQIISFTGTAFITESVPAESQGLEFEGRWAATDALALGASATYADARQTDTDTRLPYSPRWAVALNATYVYPWQNAALEWRLDSALNYRDTQYMQRDERGRDGPLTLFDLRLALASADDTWELALLGRNLLDQATSFTFDYPAFGGTTLPYGSTTIGSLNRPRTVALQARYTF